LIVKNKFDHQQLRIATVISHGLKALKYTKSRIKEKKEQQLVRLTYVDN